MKKVSVYVKGDRNSTDYYRIYQYLDKLDGKYCRCVYRLQMGGTAYKKWMPVSDKPFYIKVVVYFYIYFRRLYGLMCDWINPPHVLILHRSLIGRYVPYSFRFLLEKIVSKGTILIWDYDDQIIANGEVSQAVFNKCAKLATHVLVTHDYLKSLLPIAFQDKAIIIPTTDGDMYHLFTEALNKRRLEYLSKRVVLVWVATAGNMIFLESIIAVLDEVACLLRKSDGRELVLKVICNASLPCKCKNLIVENIPWTRTQAIQGMMDSHIGIMPLIDNEVTRGKGGFKLIQYLSIGLPCIGSNVGYNNVVISTECGFLVKNATEWKNAILELSNIALWKSYSISAFHYWESHFSYERNLKVWRNLIKFSIDV